MTFWVPPFVSIWFKIFLSWDERMICTRVLSYHIDIIHFVDISYEETLGSTELGENRWCIFMRGRKAQDFLLGVRMTWKPVETSLQVVRVNSKNICRIKRVGWHEGGVGKGGGGQGTRCKETQYTLLLVIDVVVCCEVPGAHLLSVRGSQFLFDSLFRSFGCISSLNVFLDSNERFLESIEAGRVQHLLFDFGSVWAPGH